MSDGTPTTETPVVEPMEVTEEAVPTIVHFTDGYNEQQAFYLKLVKSNLDDETLSDLRAIIAGCTGSIEVSHLPFCTKKAAVVPDSFGIDEYLKDCLHVNVTDAVVLDVYMKCENVSSRSSGDTIDISRVIEGGKLAGLKQEVDETTFKLLTGTNSKYIPELEEQDWSVVVESNSLCYGICVIRAKTGNVAVGVEKARYPAFRLKKRTILSDNITNRSLQDVEMDLRIPEYIIDDKSYITVYETESAAQLAMVTSAFSEADVEAAGSGSFWGCSLAAKAGYGHKVAAQNAMQTRKTSKQVTIAYNFPRATLLLDERSLELTQQCQKAICNIVDGPSLTRFLDDYGEFFSRRVQVGGRLFATEDVSAAEVGSSKETANSMKAVASLSFTLWGMGPSGSSLLEQKGSGAATSTTSCTSKTLAWQANGGDTLLANSPREWTPTVAYHWNWRITQQDRVCTLIDLLSEFEGQRGLVDKVKAYDPKTSLGISPGKHKRFTLSADKVANGRYLVAFRSATKNLTHTAEIFNAAKKGCMPPEPCLANRGCVFMGPKEALRSPIELALQADTTNCSAATTLHYGTEYYVKHVATDTWIGFLDGIGGMRPLFAASSKEARVKFINPDDTDSTSEIMSNGKVMLEIHWSSKVLYLYDAVEDRVHDHAYLCATRDNETSRVAQIMRVRY